MRIIDCHTHAFPDGVAARAMPALERQGGIRAVLDGTLGSLLASMDQTGIEVAVVASIATKPDQFNAIAQWSKDIASDRIIPFPSVHPDDPNPADKVRLLAREGFKGIKIHAYYQDTAVDDKRMEPIYRALEDTGLILLLHTGFDPAFPRVRKADPARVLAVLEAFPALKLVTSHMGGWKDWKQVEDRLLGRPIYMDLSYSLPFMPQDCARSLVRAHPSDYVLFGSDSPWGGQRRTVDDVRALGLGGEWERRVCFDNAARLLGLTSAL